VPAINSLQLERTKAINLNYTHKCVHTHRHTVTFLHSRYMCMSHMSYTCFESCFVCGTDTLLLSFRGHSSLDLSSCSPFSFWHTHASGNGIKCQRTVYAGYAGLLSNSLKARHFQGRSLIQFTAAADVPVGCHFDCLITGQIIIYLLSLLLSLSSGNSLA